MDGFLIAGIISAILGAGLSYKAKHDQTKAQKKALDSFEENTERLRQNRVSELLGYLDNNQTADSRAKTTQAGQQQAQNRLAMLINDNADNDDASVGDAPVNLSNDALASRADSAAKGADLMRALTLRYGRLQGLGEADFNRSVNDSIFNASQGRYAALSQQQQNQLQRGLFNASQKGGKTALAGSLASSIGGALMGYGGGTGTTNTDYLAGYDSQFSPDAYMTSSGLPVFGSDASGNYYYDYRGNV